MPDACLKTTPEAVSRLLAVFFVIICCSTFAQAEPGFEQEDALDFGALALPNNSAPAKALTLPITGSVGADPGMIQISPPVRGQYRLTGFPPNTRISVTSSKANLSAGGRGQPPFLVFTELVSNRPLTDDLGNADLVLAGTLETSATGQGYPDAPYAGTMIIELSYWSPEAERVVANSEVIEINASISTALDLTEVQVLSFGRIAATAGTDGQAQLVLDPDGSHAAKGTDEARIVPLNDASPAIIVVEGAAAFYDLVITAQPKSVFLTHKNLPGAPKFEVTDFVSLPESVGRTDRDGMLEIRVGATLKTEQTTSVQVYPEGNYSGTYTLTVEY